MIARRSLVLIPILLFLGISTGARAENQAYSATVGGATRTPDVLIYYADEAPYVPLFELAQELGGTGRVVSPGQAEITIDGRTATVSLNNVRFDAQGDAHDLQKPFLKYESEVLAPRDEIIGLFRTAFGIELATGATPPPPVAEEMEELPLLEPVSVPAPAEETAPVEEPAMLETGAIAPVTEGAAEGAAEEVEAEPAKPGKIRTIILDAGHGGNDTGVQPAGGAAEEEICLAVANKVAELLKEDKRFTVVLTRPEDKAVSLAERVALVKQQESPFLLSIHTGANLSPAASGTEVFYSGEFSRSRVSGSQGKGAAETIATALAAETGGTPRGVRRAPIQIITQSDALGCLVELGNLSNPDQAAQLAAAEYQDKAARGLANALQQLAGEE